MIKKIIFSMLLSLPAAWAVSQQQSVYNISFKDIQGNQVTLQSFSGKKMLIAVLDAAHPDEMFLKKLDTLYRNNSSTLQVIAVPVSDFGRAISHKKLTALYNRLQLGFILSQTAKGKKANGAQQHPALYWLTHSISNTHFDNDVEEPGQLFVISETGDLFAVMNSKASPTSAAMARVISRQIK